MTTKTKLYCFVDESGQDTKGELFLVAIILHDTTNLILLEDKLELLEKQTGKSKLKWKKTNKDIKIKYRKIRGIKDEQNVFIRLADTMAGFLRDMTEKQSYTNIFTKKLIKNNIVANI